MSKNLISLFDDKTRNEYQKKQVIIHEGESIQYLYYIVSGYVKAYHILHDGTESTIFIYGPGDMFPNDNILNDKSINRYYYSTLSQVEVVSESSRKIFDYLKQDNEVTEIFINYMRRINSEYIDRIEGLSVNDARRKIVSMLVFLVKKTGDKSNFSKLGINITQQGIADMCGLTRESASKHLGRLKEIELIRRMNGSFIVDVQKLKLIADKLDVVF